MKEIVIPIINDTYKVVVCFGGAKEIGKTLKEWHYPNDLDLTKELEYMRGRTFWRVNCHPVIALPKKPKTPDEIGTLAHEAVHAINYIFDWVKTTDEEIFAHSVGAVVRGVLSTLKDSGKGKNE